MTKPRRIVRTTVVGPDGHSTLVEFDLAESPLAWLHSRRGKDGADLFGDDAFAAGERLRRDFTLGALEARTTMNWSSFASGSERRRGAGGTDFSDGVMAARARVSAAVQAVGPELGGILVDVCCFLKGLPEVERERGWPARSGKLLLAAALGALARHYGYGTPSGAARRALRHWGAPDYRPKP
ncbi:DUF6456 domain-containing protein [Methylobrevis pamukkalensis]|uniref:DUF6456 domain-containing protein n=1 Tax=Methylobrevis pamukkalensis TaxID=1439726 RepID=A0A1E3H7W6_9HYPH|nr:DUF6456 domain-containing protein [Methylobrevis pamukkalensis]ODN72410.1 hypothetical protein A6302_00156 [Methylobrevis pamukkalensis]